MIELFDAVIDGQDLSGETIVFKTGWHERSEIRNCKLTDCQILFEGDARGHRALVVENVHGIRTSIATLGASVVNVRVRDVKLEDVVGLPSIDIAHAGCDNWDVKSFSVVHAGGVGLRCLSSGVDIENGRFEQKLDVEARQFPHIQMAPDAANQANPTVGFAGGLSTVRYCRFGGETGGYGGPPAHNILLGPETPSTGTMSGVILEGNRHFRRNGGPTADSGVAAIRITKALNQSRIADIFGVFYTAIVQEDQLGGSPQGNVFDSIVAAGHTGAVFSSGANPNGWVIR